MNFLVFAIGVAVLIFGIFQLLKGIKLSKSGIKMEADIIDVRKRRDNSTDSEGYSSTTDMYYPVYSYTYKGQEYSKESNVGVSNPRKYQVGGKMSVVFMEDKPEKSEVKGFFGLWIMPIILLLVGISLLIYAFIG